MVETDSLAQDMASRLFAELGGPEACRALEAGTWAAADWAKVEALGLPLALVSEGAGGIGLDPVEALGIVRLAGRHGLALPLAETMFAGQCLAACGFEPGEGPATVATGRGQRPVLSRQGDGWHLAGTVARVPSARFAERVAVLAQGPAGHMLALVPGGPDRVRPGSNLAGEPRDDLLLDVSLPDAAVRPCPPGLTPEGLLAQGAILRGLLMAGACEAVLAMSVRYATERVQFGRPIGRFQAVQQNLAVMAGHAAAARAAADLAAEVWEEAGEGGALLAVASAKVRIGEAAGAVAAIAHQVHGAIGFTQEYALNLYTRRLWAWRDECGNEAFWAQRIGALVREAGPDGYWPMVAAA